MKGMIEIYLGSPPGSSGGISEFSRADAINISSLSASQPGAVDPIFQPREAAAM
ncbi:hypothetical protein [Microbulbifer thermotolerans]|uniref:hypothetical protein n=1 Tax=Microbulbifer thermotolerans TaxID=252514 RepID=UPI001587A488|nr:hypothetical protein [Microbulbifer thermotolerans]